MIAPSSNSRSETNNPQTTALEANNGTINRKAFCDQSPDGVSLQDACLALFHRVSKSLLQFAAETALWVSNDSRETENIIRNTARWQTESIAPLARLMESRDWHSPDAAFPESFGRFNDVAVDYLMPEIIRDHEKTIELTARARQIALEEQDAQAMIALNRLQGEQRLLLAELRDHLRSDPGTSAKPKGAGTELKLRPQLISASSRTSIHSGVGQSSA